MTEIGMEPKASALIHRFVNFLPKTIGAERLAPNNYCKMIADQKEKCIGERKTSQEYNSAVATYTQIQFS
jgi:hypothetical protein